MISNHKENPERAALSALSLPAYEAHTPVVTEPLYINGFKPAIPNNAERARIRGTAAVKKGA